MADFQILTGYLVDSVAKPTLKHLKHKYGATALKIEAPFSKRVQWSPTIHLKQHSGGIMIVEVSDILYPAIFRTSYSSLLNEEAATPIKVYQSCPLDTFLKDPRQQRVRELRSHGFGLLTVDEQGVVTEQFQAAILVHHVAEADFEQLTRNLSPDIKSHVSRALDVYRTDGNQGIQFAGQIVEALVHFIASEANKKGWLANYNPKKEAATIIDALYTSTSRELKDQRACIGGARQSMKGYRNSTSHPAKSKQEARAKVVNLKGALLQLLRIIADLAEAKSKLKFRGKVPLA